MKISSYRKEDRFSYALGATVVMEYLLNSVSQVREVIFHPQFRSDDTIEKIKEICRTNSIEIEVAEKPFNIVSKKENCFCMAVFEKQEKELSHGSHVVLVNPSNAGNMGTIIRSAAGFGVPDIAVIKPAVDIFDPKTIRASMGAAARVNIRYFSSFDEYRGEYPENNLYPFMLDGSVILQNTEINEPFSLILGNEATGLPSEFSKIGQPVRIEITKEIDSLNLPIAGSIALYHATSKRMGGK